MLVGLANHACPDGTGAFPSVATLVRYTGLSERTVRTCLDRLEAAHIIQPCDPDIVAARIKRADRRPQGWDLNLAMVRDDLAAADIGVREHQFPGLGARLDSTGQAGPDAASHRVQPPHPTPAAANLWITRRTGCCQPHPASGTGCSQRTGGVQPVPARGAAVAPEPYKEPSREPPAAAPAREAPPAASGGPAGEYFAALGDRWQLTGRQRARLIPAVMAALAAGWTPHGLAAFTGANTAGVRNPYAVLAARLSPGELPPPQGQRPTRPPWCGECDQATRMLVLAQQSFQGCRVGVLERGDVLV